MQAGAVPSATLGSQVVGPGDPGVILRLRLGGSDQGTTTYEGIQHVQWEEGVVDNEHMMKKKSNKCCIYRKPRPFDESESDSSGTDEEEEFRQRYPQYAGKQPPTRKRVCGHKHDHKHNHNIDENGPKHCK
mmetsp:Transcript_20053/g.33108  ORF Transcript_20053/g.33108 Transcript_20053/m.33108 type:complete len:131 (-) Transcript_20053:962-1354(-)